MVTVQSRGATAAVTQRGSKSRWGHAAGRVGAGGLGCVNSSGVRTQGRQQSPRFLP